MRTFTVAATVFVVMSPTMATAATLPLPTNGKPLATVTILDNWSHKIDKDGDYEIVSKDETVIVSIRTVAKLKSEAEIAADAAKELGKDTEIVPGSMKSRSDQVNGMKAAVTRVELKAKGADRTLPVTDTQIVTPKPDFVIEILVSEPRDKAHSAEVDAMFGSVKLVE